MIIVTPSFSKSTVFKLFSAKPAFSNSSGLRSVFKKLNFRDGLLSGGWPNRGNKATFTNLSGVVCTEPESFAISRIS